MDIPAFSDMEYQQHLNDDNWTRAETDHLFDLAKRFDLRFIVIKDRWDDERFPNRSVEDLKERYYSISNNLAKVLKKGISWKLNHSLRVQLLFTPMLGS